MSLRRLLSLLPIVFLTACATSFRETSSNTLALQGRLHGGQQPVSGSVLQLYAVGLSGGGSSATPLLNTPGTSDSNGGFNITGTYSCPTAASQVYLLASGGNPGLAPGTNNTAIALMAALGPCGNLSASTFINVDEVTTIALANTLSPFTASFSGTSAIGSTPNDASLLNAAFTMANRFASTPSGTAPGTNIPAGDTVPVAEINTLANILAGCINSAGGTAGDGSACGRLFSLAAAPGITPPTDTFTAAIHIADNPALNVSALFNTSSASAPFQPALTVAPSDFSLSLGVPAGLQSSVTTAAFGVSLVGAPATAQTITLSNTSASAIALSPITLTGTSPADFAQTNNCPASLPASASCAVQVIFTPVGSGRRVAALAVTNGSALSPSARRSLRGRQQRNHRAHAHVDFPLFGQRWSPKHHRHPHRNQLHPHHHDLPQLRPASHYLSLTTEHQFCSELVLRLIVPDPSPLRRECGRPFQFHLVRGRPPSSGAHRH